MTFAAAENRYLAELSGRYDTGEIRAIFLICITQYTGMSRAQFLASKQLHLTPAQTAALIAALSELKTGRPVQYITGETEFFGLKFNVNPSVLIPRPETEELVDWILSSAANYSVAPGSRLNVLDIGTGSGCIAIAIKQRLPEAGVWGIDISAGAIETAKANAALNKVEVRFITANILQEEAIFNGQPEFGEVKFNVIASNPPYIPFHEQETMLPLVTDHEPHLALFVENDDPLQFYRAIAGFATARLHSHGQLFFEINEAYGPQVTALLAGKGFKNIELRKDLNGRDRMVSAVWMDSR